MTPLSTTEHPHRPLCVDVDGTLLRSDLLVESICCLAKQSPRSLLRLPLWFLRGRATLKREIASRITFDGSAMPLNAEVVKYCSEEAAKGRQIVLATASDRDLATTLTESLPFPVTVLGSDGTTNLKGRAKAERLVGEYGERGFEYLGNSTADLPVWKRAAAVGVVSNDDQLVQKAGSGGVPLRRFAAPRTKLVSYLRAMRVYQWVKNILLFVPLFLAHQFADIDSVLRVVVAFFAFGLCASSVYLMNDLLDLPSDRKHARKRSRPLASGEVPIVHAMVMLPLLLAMAASLAWMLPGKFALILVLYLALNLGYSFYLKQLILVDIVLLGGMYALRILAGGFAAPVIVSEWLLAFALFFFFSLACMKRFSELYSLRQSNQSHSRGRGYRADDLEQIGVFGSSSAFMSILVLALYVNSAEVRQLYHDPSFLWLLCPLLLYWVSRAWLIAHRGEMHDDPIIFALKEPTSYLVGFVTVLVILVAA